MPPTPRRARTKGHRPLGVEICSRLSTSSQRRACRPDEPGHPDPALGSRTIPLPSWYYSRSAAILAIFQEKDVLLARSVGVPGRDDFPALLGQARQ
jgi:hypothetical protein